MPQPVGMLNLLGRLPEPRDLLAVPGAHVHLYDKAPRPGRKLGHVTVRGPDADSLTSRLALLEERLAEELPGRP